MLNAKRKDPDWMVVQSGYFIASYMKTLLHQLSIIFNLSLDRGVFHTRSKIAHVIPIPKPGNHNKFQNYRPILLLPLFGKLFD